MSGLIKPRSGVNELGLYEAGESSIAGRKTTLKLSSNENFLGPGERARAALADALIHPERYPPTDHQLLKTAIAEACNLDPERIICGAGSDEILLLLCRAFAGPGDQILHSRHGFLMYPLLARAVGAEPVAVEETERRSDVDRLLAATSERTRLLFLANPNNPTGTMIDDAELRRLADGLPSSCLLVLDGAYVEYADGYDGGAGLVRAYENVVMTRTFSKIHGLASLRIGYGFGSRAVISAMDKLRMPFNVSGPALASAAAAIGDRAHLVRCQDHNRRLRAWLADRLASCGIPSDPSSANFILARFGSPEAASTCDARLRDDGILVRRMLSYHLPDCLRISIGDDDACRRVAASVATFAASQ